MHYCSSQTICLRHFEVLIVDIHDTSRSSGLKYSLSFLLLKSEISEGREFEQSSRKISTKLFATASFACFVEHVLDEGVECCSARFEIPMLDEKVVQRRQSIICRVCGEAGHKAMSCPNKDPVSQYQSKPSENSAPSSSNSNIRQVANFTMPRTGTDRPGYHHRPMEEMTCYRCGQKGHLSNRCPQNAGQGSVPRY